MRPIDLPEFRVRMVREFEAAIAEADDPHPELADAKRQMLEKTHGPPGVLRHWQLAELFFVTAEMANVAGQAERSMPDFELHREDLPADIGIIYLDLHNEWDRNADLCAVWGPGREGLAYSFYAFDSNGSLLIHQAQIHYGGDAIIGDDGMAQWARLVRCCWLLMQQRIAIVEEHHPDRASARRLTRQGRKPQLVRVISLRHPAPHAVSEEGHAYHHRWVVRGHWRKQWYGSQDRHVPIWISPFVKGPDGAPLLGGEKVYAWTR